MVALRSNTGMAIWHAGRQTDLQILKRDKHGGRTSLSQWLENGLTRCYRVRYYLRMKVTVKGQITIPQALRERFGLLPGTEVGFVVEPDALRIQARKRGRRAATAFDTWLVKAAGSAHTGLTTDQIMTATRGED